MMIDSTDDVCSLWRNKSVHRKWDIGYISAIYLHARTAARSNYATLLPDSDRIVYFGPLRNTWMWSFAPTLWAEVFRFEEAASS